MKAIILAGGYGRRLSPITDFISKSLLPINGIPLISYIIESINKLPDEYKAEKIVISTNKKYSSQFEYYKAHSGFNNLELIVEPSDSEENKLGAIRGLEYVLKKVGCDEALVVAGDNYFDFDLKPLLEKYYSTKCTVVGLYKIEDKNEAARFGVVQVDEEGRIVSFVEKPSSPSSSTVSTGIYVLNKEAIDMIQEYLSDHKDRKDSTGSFISWLIGKMPVYSYTFEGRWEDIGTKENYRNLINSLDKSVAKAQSQA
ncbi:MAG: nucleotidyltransferase family protein [Conexivisphaerales archaeon]